MGSQPNDDTEPAKGNDDTTDNGNEGGGATPKPDNDPDDGLGDAGKKALERERQARRDAEKQAKEAADQLKQYQDAEKSETQRLQSQLDELKPTADEAKRLRVALKKGLTEAQAKRLVGDSEEDLESDADELLATFQPAKPDDDGGGDGSGQKEGGEPRRAPQENLKPGAAPSSEPDDEETDPRKLAENLPPA